MRIAIPTNNPGGFEAKRSGHFGQCDVFTVVDIEGDGAVADISTLKNDGHGKGGCMAPVTLLKNAGVEAIIVDGLGKKPMQGFSQAGIVVYYASQETVPDVKSVFVELQAKSLPVMHPAQLCQGSENCNH